MCKAHCELSHLWSFNKELQNCAQAAVYYKKNHVISSMHS